MSQTCAINVKIIDVFHHRCFLIISIITTGWNIRRAILTYTNPIENQANWPDQFLKMFHSHTENFKKNYCYKISYFFQIGILRFFLRLFSNLLHPGHPWTSWIAKTSVRTAVTKEWSGSSIRTEYGKKGQPGHVSRKSSSGIPNAPASCGHKSEAVAGFARLPEWLVVGNTDRHTGPDQDRLTLFAHELRCDGSHPLPITVVGELVPEDLRGMLKNHPVSNMAEFGFSDAKIGRWVSTNLVQ